jgi:hypothetical protein
LSPHAAAHRRAVWGAPGPGHPQAAVANDPGAARPLVDHRPIRAGDKVTVEFTVGSPPTSYDLTRDRFRVNVETRPGETVSVDDRALVSHTPVRRALHPGQKVVMKDGNALEVASERRNYVGGGEYATWSHLIGFGSADADTLEGIERMGYSPTPPARGSSSGSVGGSLMGTPSERYAGMGWPVGLGDRT